MTPIVHRRLFVPVVAGVVLLAWVALGLWHQSPWGRYLHHAELGAMHPADDAHAALVQSLVYVAGWTLMTVAMMLPTTLPLLEMFRRLVAERDDRTTLLARVVAGYLAVWLAFGVAAHAFDLALHALLERSAWLAAHTWVFGAAPLLAAGAFQFSSLKHRCLDKCRAPLSFVLQHWTGGNPRAQAWRLGVDHGAYCVGCCWALMLLMFAVGTGSLGWMLALGAVMAVEKNAPWGRRLSAPLGIALIAWGVLILFEHAATWQ